MSSPFICMDPFGARQFDPANKAASCPIRFDEEKFTAEINRIYEERKAAGQTQVLADGYAPFCKHIFVPNFVGADVGYLPITDENEHLLRSGYEARTEKELAVLSRWFPRDKVEIPQAKFLDVILYSREQIRVENAATGTENSQSNPWGIISVKPQLEDFETPMAPITMMRNALPKKEGGSGVSLDPDKYKESVAFWAKYAIIK
mmetsp:Transcript_39304/g.77324  ORF Transcript_39304/g.77324 Transcript_39304/m.77324 type:complete len:204 (+) Transcript_39304:77-688(+)|eukprot:CAMPEP_0175120708 /NCGR_PEP_ID=MMETSP0087-20121206/768_1 /TAXON_ID=136419 /ORGANISM="Unknown Unknown, Strain D1" /LENGTH=203 /DNA_ID=CAMNT_0016402179 /DNA_START=77 /DNA_END=688 /DNA_ORIENTATION=+